MHGKHLTFTLVAAGFIPFIAAAFAQETSTNTEPQETLVTIQATGTFDVAITPLELDDASADSGLGRMSLDKQFHGDLEATGNGEMLTAMTKVNGSAGYVAVERIEGTLHGKKGSFALQHRGVMTRGEPELLVTVVPDSGTDELEEISGEMKIRIEGGNHYYDFEYTLPE